jgi:glutamate synthase (NADPH/NADH) small chain
MALGFSGAEEASAAAMGLTLNEKGRLGTGSFSTEDPQVFSCGDMRRGASLVVWAIAEGRACARAVDEYLEGYTNM